MLINCKELLCMWMHNSRIYATAAITRRSEWIKSFTDNQTLSSLTLKFLVYQPIGRSWSWVISALFCVPTREPCFTDLSFSFTVVKWFMKNGSTCLSRLMIRGFDRVRTRCEMNANDEGSERLKKFRRQTPDKRQETTQNSSSYSLFAWRSRALEIISFHFYHLWAVKCLSEVGFSRTQ